MAGSKKFFQDRIVLLLLSINTFLTVFSGLYVLLRLSSRHSTVFIVQYRSNLSLSAYTPGSVTTFAGFVLFMLLVLGFHTVLARRVFHIRRHLSIVIMGLGTLLILLAAVVGSALLGLV